MRRGTKGRRRQEVERQSLVIIILKRVVDEKKKKKLDLQTFHSSFWWQISQENGNNFTNNDNENCKNKREKRCDQFLTTGFTFSCFLAPFKFFHLALHRVVSITVKCVATSCFVLPSFTAVIFFSPINRLPLIAKHVRQRDARLQN